jgi:hypothetical protein
MERQREAHFEYLCLSVRAFARENRQIRGEMVSVLTVGKSKKNLSMSRVHVQSTDLVENYSSRTHSVLLKTHDVIMFR